MMSSFFMMTEGCNNDKKVYYSRLLLGQEPFSFYGNPTKATVLCCELKDYIWFHFSSEGKFVSSLEFLKRMITVLLK